jgi:Ca2+-transporting ATPase
VAGNLNLARTMAFATVGIVSLVYIFAFKNLKKLTIQTENFFQNKFLIVGVAYGFLLFFAAIYLPFLNRFLETVPLEPFHWLLVFSVALMTVFLTEAVKIATSSKSRFFSLIEKLMGFFV